MENTCEIKCPWCGWQPVVIENVLPTIRQIATSQPVMYRCGKCRRAISELRVALATGKDKT